jgi:RHS repeat-associated protein
MNAETNGPLGFGWTDSYNMSLSLDSETGAAVIREENGSTVIFQPNGENDFEAPPQVLATLKTNEDGTYTFSRYADHVRYAFSATGQLLSEADRNGNTTTLTYSSGLLQSVTDPSGRSLTFAYTGSHIHTITDPMGRATTFAYDESGNLKEAIDPMGRKWSFTYDAEHRLLTMTDPRGGTTTNAYDSSSRVTAQVDPMGRKSTWSYEGDPTSPEGGSTIFTDGRGDATLYEYQDLELDSITHGYETEAEATTSYSYDPITLGLTTIIDPDGNETHNRYDNHGNLVETSDPLGRASYYEYGFEDELLSATDPAGTTTSYIYDGNGNLLEKETPLTETGEIALTTYAYEGAPGELTSVTDPDGHTTQFGYDEAGDRTSVTDADGNETTYTYNADSELTSMVSPAGNVSGGKPSAHTTSYTYDAAGEITTETDQLGHATSYGYDGDGNRTSVVDANGHKTKQTYDADNELIEVVRPDSSILKTKWDAAGNMTAQVDAAGHTTSYAYNSLDRLVSTTDPDGHTTSYGYDPAGNKTKVVNAEGEVTEYGYDSAGELTFIEYLDGTTPSVYMEYDADGNRTELFDGTGTSTYSYDSLNRMTGTTDGSEATVSYEYDLTGHVIGVIYPNGKKVTRAYDPAGKLTSVEDWLGHTTKFSYSSDSNLEKELYPNSVVTQRQYDNADRLTSITDTKGATQLATFNYTRDATGQLASESIENGESEAVSFTRNSLDQLTAANGTPYGYDAANNPTTFGDETTQQFDPANELTSAMGPGELPEEENKEKEGGGSEPPSEGSPQPPLGATPAPTPRKRVHCRRGSKRRKVHGRIKCLRPKKKRHGHRKHRASASAQTANGVASDSRASYSNATSTSVTIDDGAIQNAAGPVSTSSTGIVTHNFSYNTRGDRISEELVGGATRTLTYDQADRLIGVNGNISYAYDGDGLRTSKTVNGIATDFVWNQAEPLPELLQNGSTYYVYGPEGQPIEQITGTTPTYLHSDQQGSTRLLTNDSGSPVGRYDYTPWGSVAKHSGSGTTNLQYDGQYTDSETGYQYLRFRYYDPPTGQFLTPDPIFPLTRERYQYVEDNPLDATDPYGLCIFGHNAGGGCKGGGVLHNIGKFSEDLLDVICLGKDLGILCISVPPGLNPPGSPGGGGGSLAALQLGPPAVPLLPTLATPCYEPLPYIRPLALSR